MKEADLKRFVNPPVLVGENVVLRKMTPKDVIDVNEYASDELVPKYLLWKPHPSIDYTKKYLKHVEKCYKKGTFYDWAIEYGGKVIGTCGFTSFSIENQCGEIGYVLNSGYWGKGLARESALLVIKYGFEVLELNRIEARYMAENTQSRRVMEKCDMKFEGVLRSSIFSKGKFHDIGVCSILRAEYINNKIGVDF